jgi:hypothetical protein
MDPFSDFFPPDRHTHLWICKASVGNQERLLFQHLQVGDLKGAGGSPMFVQRGSPWSHGLSPIFQG